MLSVRFDFPPSVVVDMFCCTIVGGRVIVVEIPTHNRESLEVKVASEMVGHVAIGYKILAHREPAESCKKHGE